MPDARDLEQARIGQDPRYALPGAALRDWPAYLASIDRLVRFVDRHAVPHVIGAHIEPSADNVEDADQAMEHPNEHPLSLAESYLRDLLATVNAMATTPVRTARQSYVVVPLV